MNIFALDDNPTLAAQWQHDKHVVKMTLETAQLLSSALHLRPDWMELCPDPVGLYRTTHANHPCAVWCRANLRNLSWLIFHGFALSNEYTERFGKRHASRRVIQLAFDTLDALYKRDGVDPAVVRTPFAQAMPEKYREPDDAVLAYRRYYIGEKCHVDTKWTRRDHLPNWLLDKALDVRPGAKRRDR